MHLKNARKHSIKEFQDWTNRVQINNPRKKKRVQINNETELKNTACSDTYKVAPRNNKLNKDTPIFRQTNNNSRNSNK